MEILKVAVLSGGPSEEHEISLQTGEGVIKHLSGDSFAVCNVHITREGTFKIDDCEVSLAEIVAANDVLFLALHGTYGEDGKLQEQLETLNACYTGSNSVGSASAFNKKTAKDIVARAGIRTVPAVYLTKPDISTLEEDSFSSLNTASGLVVKPVASGSSFGTQIIHDVSELVDKVKVALDSYEAVMVEERIVGVELTCGVIERMFSEPLSVLPAVKIIPPESAEFFDLTVKYNGNTQELCPAPVSDDITTTVQQAAMNAHQVLGLTQYSRSDFIVKGNTAYYLETNTLPGLTAESLYPKEIVAAGKTYADLVQFLVTDAYTQKR